MRTPYRYCHHQSVLQKQTKYCMAQLPVYEGDKVLVDGSKDPGTVEAFEGQWRVSWPDGRGLLLRYVQHLRPYKEEA